MLREEDIASSCIIPSVPPLEIAYTYLLITKSTTNSEGQCASPYFFQDWDSHASPSLRPWPIEPSTKNTKYNKNRRKTRQQSLEVGGNTLLRVGILGLGSHSFSCMPWIQPKKARLACIPSCPSSSSLFIPHTPHVQHPAKEGFRVFLCCHG